MSTQDHMINARISVLALDRFTVVDNKQSLVCVCVHQQAASVFALFVCQYCLINSRNVKGHNSGKKKRKAPNESTCVCVCALR